LTESKLAFSTQLKPSDVLLSGLNDADDDSVHYAKVEWTAAISGSNQGIREIELEVLLVNVDFTLNGQEYQVKSNEGWNVELENVMGLPLQPVFLAVDVRTKRITVEFQTR